MTLTFKLKRSLDSQIGGWLQMHSGGNLNKKYIHWIIVSPYLYSALILIILVCHKHKIRGLLFSAAFVVTLGCIDPLHTFWREKAHFNFVWPELWYNISMCACEPACRCMLFIFPRSLSEPSLTHSSCQGNAKLLSCWIEYQWLFDAAIISQTTHNDNRQSDCLAEEYTISSSLMNLTFKLL